MVIKRKPADNGRCHIELLDDSGEPIVIVSAFLRYLVARDCSPNTIVAYAHDLQHFWRFLANQELTWETFRLSPLL